MMVEFWRKLGLILGLAVPPEVGDSVAQEAPKVDQLPTGPVATSWALGFDSMLPGVRGVVSVPIGPGQTRPYRYDTVTVNDVFGAFQYLVQLREQWPFGPDPDTFVACVALAGPGWELTAFFRKPGGRVEYFAVGADGGARLSGEVRWELLAQALVLSPDFDAVVGYLTLSPYHMPYRGV